MRLKIFSIALILFSLSELFPQKVGDAYAIDINNVYMPLNRKGVLADVNVPPSGSGGQFSGIMFLFSGGFFLSGQYNGYVWANAVASASLVEDYLQGTVDGENDPNAVLYRVGSNDIPFGQSWQDWSDAVGLGADFYDGNNDGIYYPIDLNGNSQWDPNEDCPDLLGDEMLWCVFHDGVPVAQRRWNTTLEVGIEVRQTVFAYSSLTELENMIFVRYRIKYVGLGVPEPDFLEDVYFGVWDDSDLGSASDDLVGCDTILSGGYTFNAGPDPLYGDNPPCFFTKTLSGPLTYIPGVTFIDNNGNGTYEVGTDTPLDTAYVHRGQLLGTTEYPGAKNLELSSALHYMNSDPNVSDPINKDEARNYMLGHTKSGELIDPCTWPYGTVYTVNCAFVNPLFWYSGDPTTGIGWFNNYPTDQRQMQNMGPFTLEKGEEKEIFVAYVVGQGSDYLTSIIESKNISSISGVLYNSNFDTSSIVSVKEIFSENIPNKYSMSQNYPNPFNPSTTIEFSIPEKGFVLLKVYDLLGNEVATLVNEELSSGKFSAKFDGNNSPSGVYFYQLRVGDLIQTKKMVLTK